MFYCIIILTNTGAKAWALSAVVVELATVKGWLSLANTGHVHTTTLFTRATQSSFHTTLEGVGGGVGTV